jgi:hypothetical protein
MFKLALLCLFILTGCPDDQPYLSGHIRRASDAIMLSCDPYNNNALHTCVVYASAFLQKLVIYDATTEEMVLSPIGYFPLNVKVGTSTNKLARVHSDDKRFPYFLALNQATPAIYATQAFPSGTHKSFEIPKEQLLTFSDKPYNFAAWQGTSHVYVLVTYRDTPAVGLFALNAKTGLLDPQKKPKKFSLGQRPSHIEIDHQRKFALISDESDAVIHRLDITTAAIDSIFAGKLPPVNEIKIDTPTNKIYLQNRDFGFGNHNYLAALKAAGKELLLINIDTKKTETKKTLSDHPQAAYFPDAQSNACCNNQEKNWLAVADISGHLSNFIIKKSAKSLSLEEASKEDLLSEQNLALSQIELATIIGGHVEFDPNLKRPQSCTNNRKMFYVASFGSSRPRTWTAAEAVEEEAQAYSCEGDGTATRFGYKREQ